ncbi:MAG: hypothetical protein ACTSU2_10795, partial [Promethearchaeota archaeon]
MPKDEKIREKAQKALNRAEAYLDVKKHDRAYKDFLKAADLFFQIKEYKIAEQCYFYASKSLLHEAIYLEASNSMRNAANCCVMLDDYQKAYEYYDVAAKYALKSPKRDAEFRSILSAAFAYLCLFLKGQQDKGLMFIKRIKKHVDSQEFAENKLIRLVKGLTLAILNRNDSALKTLEKEFINYKFREAEMKLIKDAILMAKTHLLLEFELELNQNEFINESEILFKLIINTKPLELLKEDPFLKYTFKSIKIIDISVILGDNVSLLEKPVLPINLKEEKLEIPFRSRANFPGPGFIGPIVFTIELDSKLYFFAKTDVKKINIKSPPTQLGINLRPLINPIINRTFPMEITLSNKSEADAVNIVVEFEFPKSLRLMRGTPVKKIYNLIRNEEIKWQLSLKPLEPGQHIIKTTVT